MKYALLLVILAVGSEPTAPALGLACHAYVPAMQDKPVVCLGEELRWDMLHQLLLGFEGRLGVVGKPEAVGNPEDVRVYRHRGKIERDRQDHVGRLASHTRDGEQRIDIGGYLAVKLADQLLGHAYRCFALLLG